MQGIWNVLVSGKKPPRLPTCVQLLTPWIK